MTAVPNLRPTPSSCGTVKLFGYTNSDFRWEIENLSSDPEIERKMEIQCDVKFHFLKFRITDGAHLNRDHSVLVIPRGKYGIHSPLIRRIRRTLLSTREYIYISTTGGSGPLA